MVLMMEFWSIVSRDFRMFGIYARNKELLKAVQFAMTEMEMKSVRIEGKIEIGI